MRWTKHSTKMSVDVERGKVILTTSPLRAHRLAVVINETRPVEEWMREAARLLMTAADRMGIPSDMVPHVSRRQFLHNWQAGDAPALAQVIRAQEAAHPEVAAQVVATESVAAKPAGDHHEVAASVVHAAALQAAGLAQEAVDSAADRAAEAALTARDQRSAAVRDAAQAVATRVAQAAAAVESEADAAALTVAQAAFDAAFEIASTITPGDELDAALTATLVATAVSAMAIKTAAVTASARAEVAHEAAMAASAAALAASDAAQLMDLEVACAAEAVRAVATETALTLAKQTDAQAVAFAMAGH